MATATRITTHIERALAECGGELKLKTPQQGAATSVLLATSPLAEGIGA
jgi:hypothetical protein